MTSTPLDALIMRANLIGTSLAAATYGIHVSLFLRTLTSGLRLSHTRARSLSRWLLAYFCVLFALATVGFALQLQWSIVVFVDNVGYSGGPFQYLKDHIDGPTSNAITAIYLVLNWFTDGILIWRFYVFCNRRWYALVPSVLTLVALIIVGTMFISDITALSINLWTDLPIAPGLAYMSVSLAVNVLITLFMVARIAHLCRGLRAASGRTYLSTIILCVSSASIYSVLILISVIFIAVNVALQAVLLPMLGQILAIPPLIIAVQVYDGREHGTPTAQHLSSTLQFGTRTTTRWSQKYIADGPDAHAHGASSGDKHLRDGDVPCAAYDDLEAGPLPYPEKTHSRGPQLATPCPHCGVAYGGLA